MGSRAVLGAVFSPDGTRVLTASNDNTARPREAFPNVQQLIDRMKAELPRCLTVDQRKHFYLPPAAPCWCYTMQKWPFDMATLAAQQPAPQ